MTGRFAAAGVTVTEDQVEESYTRADGVLVERLEGGSVLLTHPTAGSLHLPPGMVDDLDAFTFVTLAPPVELGPPDVPVHAAFARVMSEVGAIRKTHEHDAPGARFLFRGIEDVQAALYPILVRHGSFILPGKVLERRDLATRHTNDGKPVQAVALHVEFRFVGPRGDSLTFEGWGEGQDRSDKGTGKAHSMAAKSALLQAFMIPTEDQPDADRVDREPEPSPEQQAAREEALQRATEAVTNATTLDQLNAIGGEAARQGILNLVTVIPGGQRMPLKAYGEQRIAELKADAPAGDTGDGGAGGEQG